MKIYILNQKKMKRKKMKINLKRRKGSVEKVVKKEAQSWPPPLLQQNTLSNKKNSFQAKTDERGK
jgi:hypothetical protein